MKNKLKSSLDRFKDTVNGNGPSSFFWESIGYGQKTMERWYGEGLPADVRLAGHREQWAKPPYDYFGLDWVNFAPVSHEFAPAFQEDIVPVTGPESYEAVLFRRNASSPERWGPDRWTQWQKEAKIIQAPVAVFVIGFFAIIRELMGAEEGLISFHINPELIRRILRDHCDFCIELIRRAGEKTRIDFCYLWEDMSYKNGMLISPATFKDFIAPEAGRFIRAIKGFGVPLTIVDSDGDIRELIPLYLECGANGFLPFEVQAGMDIRDIRKHYPELIIIGGIDKLAVARGGDVLEREISEKAGPMIAQGRYIPALDHQAHPEMSLANYRKYICRVTNLLSK